MRGLHVLRGRSLRRGHAVASSLTPICRDAVTGFLPPRPPARAQTTWLFMEAQPPGKPPPICAGLGGWPRTGHPLLYSGLRAEGGWQ